MSCENDFRALPQSISAMIHPSVLEKIVVKEAPIKAVAEEEEKVEAAVEQEEPAAAPLSAPKLFAGVGARGSWLVCQEFWHWSTSQSCQTR